MRTRAALCMAAAVLSAGISVIASRPAVAAPSGHRAFLLTSFVQSGRTDLACNEVLEFKFSTKVRKSSLDWHSLQVNEVTPLGEKPAVGARIVSGNVIRFDPRRTQRNYDDSLQPNTVITDMDHTDGFTRSASFVVRLPVKQGISTLRSRGGRRLARPFTGTFATGNACLDMVAGQPFFIGDHGTGLLGFEPPRSGATGLVDENAAIVLEFSEPMNLGSLRLQDTVWVTRTRTNQQVDGTFLPDPSAPSGRRILFAPKGGWAFDVNGEGWDVRVELTTGVTDLGGNPLKRGVVFDAFRTAAAPE